MKEILQSPVFSLTYRLDKGARRHRSCCSYSEQVILHF